MNEPTGYTALDLIGYTDKGDYSPVATYVKNDLVNYGGTKWRCKIDDTTAVTPTEGVNWTVFVAIPADTTKQIIAPVEGATSLHAYAVGKQLIYNDTLYKVIAPIAVNDALVVDTNITASDTVIEQVEDNAEGIEELNDAWKKNGAYNLCNPNIATSQVINGVTFTVNADGSVTANGTATDRINFSYTTKSALLQDILPFKGKTLKVCGCPSGGGGESYWVAFQGLAQDGIGIIDTGNGATATISDFSSFTTVQIYIAVIKNTVLNNVIFKPMITTDLNATYDDYQPYAMTNRELTEDISQSSTDITSILSNSYFTISGTGFIRKIGKLCEIYLQVKCTANTSTWTTILSSLPIPYNSKVAYQDYDVTGGTGTNTTVHITSNGDMKVYGGQANAYYHVHFIYMTN